MRIKLSSVMVGNQDHALRFYTEVLGFLKKKDIPMGEARWLSVASPEAPDDVELLLEPNGNSAARIYQKALYDQMIPLTAFEVDDIDSEYERLVKLGVKFLCEPTRADSVTITILDDTCGNYIQLYQV